MPKRNLYMNKITERAPAKINLFLEVLNKRDDGFHNIESVMTTVDFGDTVSISMSEAGINLSCNTNKCALPVDLPSLPQENNLAYKACKAYFELLDRKSIRHKGVTIEIEKIIPVRSGLAGGSADAGAVLRGLNTVFDGAAEEGELLRIARTLGADVPFCTLGGTVLCKGSGELMTPIEKAPHLHGVITVEKEEKLSTKAAYSFVDVYNSKRGSERRSSAKTVTALMSQNIKEVAETLFNVFEESCPYGNTAKKIMESVGETAAVLSGAGPSFFTLTESSEKALEIFEALKEAGYPAYIF